MEDSFLRLNRQFFDHAFWDEERPFSRAEAWLDCLQRAAFKPYQKLVGAMLVEVPLGGFVTCETFLGERWGWSRKKVHNFLTLLQQWRMISQKRAGTLMVISLCTDAGFKPEQSAEKVRKERRKSAERAPSERALSTDGAPMERAWSAEGAQLEEEKERKEGGEDKEDEEGKELPLLASSLSPALQEVQETALKFGIGEQIGEAFFHSREKRPRSRRGLWTNKRGEEIADWAADLQGFAKFWMQNLRTGSSTLAAPPGPRKDPPRPPESVSRFGI